MDSGFVLFIEVVLVAAIADYGVRHLPIESFPKGLLEAAIWLGAAWFLWTRLVG